jgi:hypothetical protein
MNDSCLLNNLKESGHPGNTPHDSTPQQTTSFPHLQLRFVGICNAVTVVLLFKATTDAESSAKPSSEKSSAVHHFDYVVVFLPKVETSLK